jgi:hypothetical protein
VTGAALLASFATISVGGATGGPMYPDNALYPHALATVSATATITAAPNLVTVFGAAVLASTATVVAGGAVPPTNITALMVLPSTVTITAAGATAGDRLGAAVFASTATITVGGAQAGTGAAAIASTVTITVGGVFVTPPAPPGFLDTLPHTPDIQMAIAFDSQPLETFQSYEAVSEYSRNASTKRGRQFELDRTEAGAANLLLDNRDGRFNPENPTSPYYPNLKPTRRFQLKAAWNSVIYTLFTGFLEGYPMAYPHVGFDRVVNQDAVDAFMALALARFIPGSTTLMSEMVNVAATAESSGTQRELISVGSTALPMPQKVPFEITIDKDKPYPETMTVVERVSATVWLVEREISRATGHTFGAAITTDVVSFGEEYTGQRIQNVLERINLPIERYIETGISLLAESDNLAGQSPLEHLQLAAEAEGGRLFVAADGTLGFYSRHHPHIYETSDRATFGDGGGTELTYIDATPTHEEEKLFNIVRIIPASGNAQEVRDEASIADHFERVLEKQWPLADDNEALSAAEYLLSRLSRMQIRIPQMTLDGSADPAQLWPVILNLELGNRYRFKMRPKDGTQMIDKTLVVEGVSHSWQPDQLRTAVQLSLADTGAYWHLGIAGKSELGDTTTITY